LGCSKAEGGDPINSFLSWIGGKKALRDEIVIRFPASFGRYVEVFGGAGWVLFHKPPGPGAEIFNDRNENLVALYRCVREKPEELIGKLEYVLNSRTDFDRIRKIMKTPLLLTDVERAALFYQQVRFSYASGLKSYANVPHSIWADFPLIRAACGRLQRVVIENKDYMDLIALYDGPDTFFYLDPPYFETEGYYRDVVFGREDHDKLAAALSFIEGKFLLSYNDCPSIREMYSRPGIMIESISRLSNIVQRYEAGKLFAELLISNYDTSLSAAPYYQMSLYDLLPRGEVGGPNSERKIIYHG
jgi:DNA adenine methylase